MDGVGMTTYEAEHLATFQLSHDLTAPTDGMRRLLHMEKNGFGIWSQRMRLRLDRTFIVIMDADNGDEMERFPIHVIREPTAFTNRNPGEAYNNVFAFIVHPFEMHIFQCLNASAADVVEDVKMAMSGRMPPSRQMMSPPPQAMPMSPFSFSPTGEDHSFNMPATGEEGYEREVAILNRCFDDIEKFIGRLQYAAAAYRELQRKQSKKKRDYGDGLLTMRARPPLEREFVDILQKFKLSFNLLSRLQRHIHEPNSPELVHFLFTPLALIVDASRGAHGPGLPPRVVTPLLSGGAVELLTHCLSSREVEFWYSLGEAWYIPRDQWKGYVGPYHPVFLDGWAPTVRESHPQSAIGVMAAETAKQMKAQHEQRMMDKDRSMSPMPNDENAQQRAFLESLHSRGARVVVVTHPRIKTNPQELTVVRGEYLEVLDDNKNWWKARNWIGEVGFVPLNIVSNLSHDVGDGRRPRQASSPSSTLSSDDDMGYRGQMKATPPPPQPRVTRSPINKISKPIEEEMMQEELRNVLTLFRQKKKIEIQKTPEVYVNQNASVKEVQEWLKAKGFSDKIRKQLANMNGNEIFSLSRDQLQSYCGRDEGRRLYSQITVSRNTTGYKTTRSSELRDILAKVRAKVDESNFEVKKIGNGAAGAPAPPKAPTGKKGAAVANKNGKDAKKTSKSKYVSDSDDDDDSHSDDQAPNFSFGLTDESGGSESESEEEVKVRRAPPPSRHHGGGKQKLGKQESFGDQLKKRKGEIMRK